MINTSARPADDVEEVQSGIVEVEIPLDNIINGEYKLLVTKLIGGSKADQPLVLNGNWESIFTY